jgi:hypothetical protein
VESHAPSALPSSGLPDGPIRSYAPASLPFPPAPRLSSVTLPRRRTVSTLLRGVFAALVAFAVLVPVATAKAPSPPEIGIGEQSPEMFSSPYFTALGVKNVRVITAWDSLRHKWSRQELDTYMAAARAAGANVLLGFGHSRSGNAAARRRVPSVAAFTKEFKKYRKRYPWVRDWLTWNEANHCGSKTCHLPQRVARFYNNIRHNCWHCNVVAADVLDLPGMGAWVREFRKTARKDGLIWGLHNYIDANRFRTSGTRELLKAAPYGKIWFTETGGLVVRRNKSRIAFPGNKRHAAAATKQVFKLAALSPRVKRIYFYNWQPSKAPLPSWDSALVDRRGRPRPAYKVLKAWIEKVRRVVGAPVAGTGAPDGAAAAPGTQAPVGVPPVP